MHRCFSLDSCCFAFVVQLKKKNQQFATFLLALDDPFFLKKLFNYSWLLKYPCRLVEGSTHFCRALLVATKCSLSAWHPACS